MDTLFELWFDVRIKYHWVDYPIQESGSKAACRGGSINF